MNKSPTIESSSSPIDNPFFPSTVMMNYIQLFNKPNQRKKTEDVILSLSTTSFINQSINIENPLSPNHNLISQPIKDFKEEILPGLFSFAQDKINHLLDLYTNPTTATDIEIENKVIEDLFKETLARTGISNSIFDPVNVEANYFLSITQNSLAMDIKILYDRLEHSAYLLENEITEDALLSLTIDILKDKGPSPVGEIGKLLQDSLSCDNLSIILREQFNGLKKFLEKYSNVFVITKNHPYNPHVFLTEQLNDDCYKHLLSNINTPSSTKSKKNKKIGNSSNDKNRKIMRDGFSSGGSSDNYDLGLIGSYNNSYISYSLPTYASSFNNNNSQIMSNSSNISGSFDPSYYSISLPDYANQPQQQQQQHLLRNKDYNNNFQYISKSPTHYGSTYDPNDYYHPSSF